MRFTLCIPTMNAAPHWPEFWAALRAQTVHPEEVIVVDSSSTDGSDEIARSNGARVIRIGKEDFRHGGARQLAAELASDVDLLLYMTQDAVLSERNSIESLLSRFDNPSIAAAYGRQLPRRNADPIEAHARHFNYPGKSTLRSLKDAPACGFKTIFFSNAFGAYRRTALMQVGGFPLEARFGEDTQVVAKMLLAGCTIAYAADATVYHSHAFTVAQEFRRYVEIGRMHASESWLEQRFGKIGGEGMRFVRSELKYLAQTAPHLCPAALVRTATKYFGYKHGRRTASTGGSRPQKQSNDSMSAPSPSLETGLGSQPHNLGTRIP